MLIKDATGATLGRRRFLGLSVASCAALAGTRPAIALSYPSMAARELRFYNLHTFESLTAVYWRDGTYLPEGLAQISYHLRDFRTGGIKPIDPTLLNILHQVTSSMECDQPINVISGYRTPATNAMLAAKSEKVAPNSFHMRGQAIDIRLPGLATTGVRDVALGLSRGGVGYYPESDFIHLDTGPIRAW
ncbi:MAG: DUF882 domain-containing protein [Rhizobiales bacterium]|nr:DUF882 domain-containing protein [Hyphomicrobiales bacterium]